MKGALKRSPGNSKAFPVAIPKAPSFQVLRRQLESDQIHRVRIGFCESCLTIDDYAKLCKSIRHNTSLTHVEVGWELPRFVLLRLLDSITQLPSLESLSLIIYASLPKRLLRRLVSIPTLKHLELRNVTIGASPWKERLILNTTGNLSMASGTRQQASVLANYFSDSIESLHLVACDFGEKDIESFCAWTERRQRPLQDLGFAFSASIASECLARLCRRANCRLLDLTGCGLGDNDAFVLAQNLPKSKTIENLVVARNPLWGIGTDSSTPPSCPGFEEFLQVAFRVLKGLDLSCCELSEAQVDNILQKLTKKDTGSSIESLTMFGIPKYCDKDNALLPQILRNNSVLKSLRIRPTADPYHNLLFSEEQVASIEESLVENYTIETLQLGHSSVLLDLLLGLNQAGRRYLRDQQPNVPVDWAKILARASLRPDVLFWLLRNGMDHITTGN